MSDCQSLYQKDLCVCVFVCVFIFDGIESQANEQVVWQGFNPGLVVMVTPCLYLTMSLSNKIVILFLYSCLSPRHIASLTQGPDNSLPSLVGGRVGASWFAMVVGEKKKNNHSSYVQDFKKLRKGFLFVFIVFFLFSNYFDKMFLDCKFFFS